MAELSPEALVRLQEAEKALHEKWGRTAGIIMASTASALFINGATCDEHKGPLLFDLIENLFQRIVPKLHPTKKEEILADVDAMLVKLFEENYPGRKFEVTRTGGDVLVDSIDPPPEGISLH